MHDIIADALLYDAIQQNVDILLLTGDITDAGGEAHEALIQKLKTAKAMRLTTYVLPGNHDLSAESAEQFTGLYEEFGYAAAYSRDSDSLSYSLILDNGDSDAIMLLMLDTDGYSKRTNGAYVSDITLEWIENQLKQASEKKLNLLVAGHYPILTEHVTEFTGKEALISLLKGDRFLFKRTTDKAIEFFKQVQKEYLQGTLPDHKEELIKGAGYKAFMKIADGTTYGRWIPGYIENASRYTAGFYLKYCHLSRK